MLPLPSQFQNTPHTLCRMTRYICKSMLNDQYLHMLGLPHSSTSSVLLISGKIPHYNIYSSLYRAPLDKCTPIYIVKQCICFTLIELFQQIHFQTKIPKTPPLYQFRDVLPKMQPCQFIKICPNFHINTP